MGRYLVLMRFARVGLRLSLVGWEFGGGAGWWKVEGGDVDGCVCVIGRLLLHFLKYVGLASIAVSHGMHPRLDQSGKQ